MICVILRNYPSITFDHLRNMTIHQIQMLGDHLYEEFSGGADQPKKETGGIKFKTLAEANAYLQQQQQGSM